MNKQVDVSILELEFFDLLIVPHTEQQQNMYRI